MELWEADYHILVAVKPACSSEDAFLRGVAQAIYQLKVERDELKKKVRNLEAEQYSKCPRCPYWRD